jgi:hypothetical protein
MSLKMLNNGRLIVILTTAVALLFGVGYLAANSDARDNLIRFIAPIVDYIYPDYYTFLDTCSIQEGTSSDRDTLSISLSLCNDASGTLADARVKVDSSTVKTCTAGSPTFLVAREDDGFGELVKLDSLVYGDVLGHTCKRPIEPDPRLRSFKFHAPLLSRLGANIDTVCVHFTAEIYRSDTLKVERKMEIKAPVNRTSLTMAENRAGRR